MYVGATVFMCVLILMYLWMKLMNHNIQSMTVYGNTVLLLLFAVGTAVIYCRDKATDKLKVAATIEMGIVYLLLGVQTDAKFITYVLVACIALQLPYYDKKGLKFNFENLKKLFFSQAFKAILDKIILSLKSCTI